MWWFRRNAEKIEALEQRIWELEGALSRMAEDYHLAVPGLSKVAVTPWALKERYLMMYQREAK